VSRFRIGQWLAVALSLIAAAGVVTAFPRPGGAGAPCSGRGCDGKWAGEPGCRDDQKIVASYQLYFESTPGTANLFYSRACQAAWGEFIINGTPPYLDIQLWAQPQYGGTKRLPLNPDGLNSTRVEGTTNVYRTVLASWEYSLKACHSYYPFPGLDPEGDSTSGDCTKWT
jgi:hypothetical protein